MRPIRLCLMLLLALMLTAQGRAEEEAPYIGVIGRAMQVRADAKDNARSLGRIEADTQVEVFSKGRTWTRIAYEGGMGYVLTKYVELVQRKNPFDGPMPGVSRHVALGRATRDFTFLPEGYRYPIQVKQGALLSIERMDEHKVYFPYRRIPEDIALSKELLQIQPFVPWQEAKRGDLLYAFTTFYSTHLQKEGNAGRIYNIALASDRLTGIVIPAGARFSFNAICGPYTEENGYRAAPILDANSEMGYGGGTCQVCSTIYNIVLRIPAVVEAMNWHAQGGVSYLPAGFDATVSNTKDMIFRNVLPYDLRLEFEALDGVMTAILYRA